MEPDEAPEDGEGSYADARLDIERAIEWANMHRKQQEVEAATAMAIYRNNNVGSTQSSSSVLSGGGAGGLGTVTSVYDPYLHQHRITTSAAHPDVHQYPNPLTRPKPSNRDALNALAYRLRIGAREEAPFDYIDLYESENHMHVFVVVGDKSVVLLDDRGMFPSDTLITQLRLLQK